MLRSTIGHDEVLKGAPSTDAAPSPGEEFLGFLSGKNSNPYTLYVEPLTKLISPISPIT